MFPEGEDCSKESREETSAAPSPVEQLGDKCSVAGATWVLENCGAVHCDSCELLKKYVHLEACLKLELSRGES